MRVGGGKAKGSNFERRVCKELSLWVTNGNREDVFWRSAMSGGRATIAKRRGVNLRRQAGDITATAPEGHVLTDRFFIEVKHVRSLDFLSFFTRSTGSLAKFWMTAKREARKHGLKPMIIAKQNGLPTIVVLPLNSIEQFSNLPSATRRIRFGAVEVWLYEEVLAMPFDP
jgi:hypothetical protein